MAHLKPIFDLMRKTVPEINVIHFQSNGPSTQYWNQTNFFLFNYHCNKLKLTSSSWNFSGAGNWKSAADAVGGSVKTLCDRAVTFGKNILCAKEMVDVLNESDIVK